MTTALPPDALISSTTAWVGSVGSEAHATAAPSRASALEHAAPIPVAAPVTSATLPLRTPAMSTSVAALSLQPTAYS